MLEKIFGRNTTLVQFLCRTFWDYVSKTGEHENVVFRAPPSARIILWSFWITPEMFLNYLHQLLLTHLNDHVAAFAFDRAVERQRQRAVAVECLHYIFVLAFFKTMLTPWLASLLLDGFPMIRKHDFQMWVLCQILFL